MDGGRGKRRRTEREGGKQGKERGMKGEKEGGREGHEGTDVGLHPSLSPWGGGRRVHLIHQCRLGVASQLQLPRPVRAVPPCPPQLSLEQLQFKFCPAVLPHPNLAREHSLSSTSRQLEKLRSGASYSPAFLAPDFLFFHFLSRCMSLSNAGPVSVISHDLDLRLCFASNKYSFFPD